MSDPGASPASGREARPLALCAAVVALLFASALAVLTPSYQSNDDPVMAMFASGTALALSPEAHLHNINLLLGSLLARLYEAWPLVPVYGAMLVAVQLLAQVATFGAGMTPFAGAERAKRIFS